MNYEQIDHAQPFTTAGEEVDDLLWIYISDSKLMICSRREGLMYLLRVLYLPTTTRGSRPPLDGGEEGEKARMYRM